MKKHSHELQQKIADLCGLRQSAVNIHKIGDDGDFGATVIAGITGAVTARKENLKQSATACARNMK